MNGQTDDTATLGIVDVTSPLHSLTREKANGRRTLALTPVLNT
jgi:hypothetical protein